MNITIQIPPQCEIEVLAVLQRYITTTSVNAEVSSPAPTEIEASPESSALLKAIKPERPPSLFPAVTIEDVRQVLTKISQLGKSAQVKELLASYGAKNVKELKQADFVAVIAKAGLL